MVIQTAPSVRVSIGEELGLAPGAVETGQMVAAQRALGFDYVSLLWGLSWGGAGWGAWWGWLPVSRAPARQLRVPMQGALGPGLLAVRSCSPPLPLPPTRPPGL